jgi:hypothetical protein
MYYGMKRGGPWALRYFNADENYYESKTVMMNRFQAWHNQNGRFRPAYKNMSAVKGSSPKDFRKSLLTTIGSTSYAKFGNGFQGLKLAENRAFLKKWRAWATTNHDYLKVKRDLFGWPGQKPIDGSAHVIEDRGFIFLFSPPHKEEPVRASVPLNRWIQLEENTDALYRIKEIYPREGTELGIYTHGDEFLYDMPADAAVVLSLETAAAGSNPQRPQLGNQPVQVIPAFSSCLSNSLSE